MLLEFLENFRRNLFQPLLLFFYAGFLIPIFKVKLEFPKPVYQALTIYLLLAIGWHGGEELADLSGDVLTQAVGFMLIGFCTNCVIGFAAYVVLRYFTSIRHVDAATVAGYYGSDSAGTFVTAVGVLAMAKIAFAPYMPVMLAVMEIPGCLVALFIVSQLRRRGMDPLGNMPDEPGYNPLAQRIVVEHEGHETDHSHAAIARQRMVRKPELVGAAVGEGNEGWKPADADQDNNGNGNGNELSERQLALEQKPDSSEIEFANKSHSSVGFLNKETLHEVFMNPGIFLLFAGIAIGFIGRLQGKAVTDKDDPLFATLFHGMLCLFLLEMGITACSKIKDLHTAGWKFVTFALTAPTVFATSGMLIAHGYSMFLRQPFDIGTYVLFGVLCGAASYIAVPAVQRLAIPEASPTLPLAASLGCTFSYNVTAGIPIYIMIATLITRSMPVVAKAVSG